MKRRDPTKHPVKLLYGLKLTGIVGIDPSLTGTGLTRISGSSAALKIITKRLSNKETSEHLTLRLHDLTTAILRHIEPRDIVFIEDYAYGARGRGVFTLGGFGELLRWRIWKRTKRLPVAVPISTLKQWYSGKGVCKKDQVIAQILQVYKKRFNSTDEAESYALADLGAAAIFKESVEKMNKPRKQALSMVSKKIRESGSFLL